MSLIEKVREQIAHAIANGHANEFPEPVQNFLTTIAEHVGAGAGGADPDVDSKVKALFDQALQGLGPAYDAAVKDGVERALEQVEQRLEAKIGELLLAKASDAEKHAGGAASAV